MSGLLWTYFHVSQTWKVLAGKSHFFTRYLQSKAHYTVIILQDSPEPRRRKKGQKKYPESKCEVSKERRSSDIFKNFFAEESKNVDIYSQRLEDHFGEETVESWKDSLNPVIRDFRKRSADSLFFSNEASADSVIDTIKTAGGISSAPIIEINPGFGYLTKRLLSLNVPFIKAFEKDSYFKKELKKLQLEHPDRLQIHNINFINISGINYLDKLDEGSRFTKLMEGIKPKEWTDEPCVKIIGAISDMDFLRYLNLRIVMQTELIHYGRPELYIFMSPKLYTIISPTNKLISPQSVLARCFYDIELLASFKRKDFLPWVKYETKSHHKIFKNLDSSEMHLVKIVPKRNLFERIGGSENLKPLWYFTRETCKSGMKRVVPEIEKFIPGCGYRLLRCNVHVFNVFEDLTNDQILQVFLEFIKWPEFKSSPFLYAMESLFSKFEMAPETFMDCEEKDSFCETNEHNKHTSK